MKKIIILIFASTLYFYSTILAQNLYNQPESVVYDALKNRYLISNWGDGSIVELNSEGEQKYFNRDLTRIAGLFIQDNILYVASNLEPYVGLVGFDLQTDTMAFYIEIKGSALLNDLAADTSGNIFITDYWDTKIFKVNLKGSSYSVYMIKNLNAPNGIIFDKSLNRLIVTSTTAPRYPLQAINLKDSTVSTVVNTNRGGLDGLAQDNDGNFYFSAWATNAVYQYNSSFSNTAELVSRGHAGPADIYFDRCNNILCVPNLNNNTVDFIPVSQSSVKSSEIPREHFYIKNYPNPFNACTTIQYSIPNASRTTIEIYNLQGQHITTLMDTFQNAGNHQLTWNAVENSSGVYFSRIQSGEFCQLIKMLYLK